MASNLIKDLLFDICLPAVYKAACLREKEPDRVLFVEYRTARMPDSFKLIDEELRSRGDIECRFVALDRSHVSYPECQAEREAAQGDGGGPGGFFE